MRSDLDMELIDAVMNNDIEAVELLLKSGADVNAKNNIGKTALMFAAEDGRLDIVAMLLEKGADVNAIWGNGFKALDYALNGNTNEKLDITKLLIKAGSNLESKDICGQTVLMRAVYNGYIEVVKLLLDAGVDVESEDYRQALVYSRIEEQKEIEQILIDAGTKKELKNEG